MTIFCFLLMVSDGLAALEIMNIRHWTAPDHTRIVLDVDDEPDYQIRENENLMVMTLRNTSMHQTIPKHHLLNKPGIKKIIFYQTDQNNAKIEFILDKYQKVEVFKLKKFQDKPDRIVVDIILADIKKEEPRQKATTSKKKRIIIIDPGHGGEDPGAIGKKGTYEKNIVLSISREIQKYINNIDGYRAILTRDGDYYVSFSKRLKKARNLQASLFISVHADAARNRDAKGSSVYCLSTGAASNEAAKLLAHNENLSDIFGGEADIESSNESNPIIMNMFQTNTINLSKIYAETLIKHLNMVNGLKYKIVQEAPFRVLKLPDIPAVLVETAYLSNLQEEKLLKKSDFQKSLAMAVTQSIKDYFTETDDTIEKEDSIPTIEYTIKKGDTLHAIAKYAHTTMGVLLQLNDMKLNDTLIIGRKINVPADQTDSEDEPAKHEKSSKNEKDKVRKKSFKYYTVTKGETLFIIARKHSATLNELLKINNMKITDPLLYGQKIKIPVKSNRKIP